MESWVSTDRPTSPLIHINIFTSAEINSLNHPSQKVVEGDAMGEKNNGPIKTGEMTQFMDSLGHTTMSGTRPIFPSRRAKISCKQWPGKKRDRKEKKH